MTETNVTQYLFAGDGPYSNTGTAWVNMMSSYFNTSILKGKLMLAQGNHEHPESASQQAENDIEAWFPGLQNATEGLEWLQAKVVGNVAIIVMNSQDSQYRSGWRCTNELGSSQIKRCCGLEDCRNNKVDRYDGSQKLVQYYQL